LVRRPKSPGTVGSPMSIISPNVLLLDSEDSAVARVGEWRSVGDAEAVGGSYLESNVRDNYLQFSFKGSALWIRFKFASNCGKASIIIDDKVYPSVDLYSSLAVFRYVNVAVGLDETTHTVKVGVSGEKNADSTDYYVKVDAFMYRTTEEALSLQSIEYIDLINVINAIYRIGKIDLVDKISGIDLVSLIEKINLVSRIGTIEKIAQAQWIANVGQVLNGSFETGDLAGWFAPLGIAEVTDAHPSVTRGSIYSARIKHHDTAGLFQFFTPPIAFEDVVECGLQILVENPDTDKCEITFYTTDGLRLSFEIPSPTIANDWSHRDVAAILRGQLQLAPDYRKKQFYAIRLRNRGTTDGLHIDDFTMLTLPPAYRQQTSLLNDVSVTVAAGGEGYTPKAGVVPVAPGQVMAVSFEYASSASLFAADTRFDVKVDLLNADGSVNETLTFTPPNRPLTLPNYLKYNFFVKVPSGVAYATIYGYFKNAETWEATIYMRNIRVGPLWKVERATIKKLENYSLAAAASIDVDLPVPYGSRAVAVTVKATYNASATKGVKFEVYRSQNGTDWDTVTDDSYPLPFTAGATVQETETIGAVPPYVRVKILNLDGTYAATVSLWITFI